MIGTSNKDMGLKLPSLVPQHSKQTPHWQGFTVYNSFLNGYFNPPADAAKGHLGIAACPRQLPLKTTKLSESQSAPTLARELLDNDSDLRKEHQSSPSGFKHPPRQQKQQEPRRRRMCYAKTSPQRPSEKKQRALKREACENLRLLIFGRIGNETWPVHRKDQIFEQSRGTEVEIEQLANFWFQLDENANGTITMGEFVHFCESTSNNSNRGIALRCARYLTNAARAAEQAIASNSLKITICSARGLADTDGGFGQGGSDVYCVCEIPGKSQSKFQTRVLHDTASPVWNHREIMRDYVEGDSISIKVFDRDVGKQDDYLGHVLVPASTFHLAGFQGELPLSDAGKDVNAFIKLKIIPPIIDERSKATQLSIAAAPPSEHECCREDFMRLLWLNADDDDIIAMNFMFQVSAWHLLRAPSPLLLTKSRCDELAENFRYLDPKGKGEISYESLVEADFVDRQMMHELKREYDQNGSGRLQMQGFLEILCPCGFRPNLDAFKVVDEDGRRMSLFYATLPGGADLSAWFFDDDICRLPKDLLEYVWAPRTAHPLLA